MDDPSATPRPLQFSVTALLIGTALLAGLLALRTVSHAVLLIGILGLLVAAHVVGNAFGTHLRDSRKLHDPQDGPPPYAPPLERIAASRAAANAPGSASYMRKRTSPGLWVAAAILCGASGGGYAAAKLLERWRGDEFGGWLLGIASGTVIGGIFAFLVACFLTMSYKAWAEATREDRR